MADFFISYARPDREKVEKLASALEAEGWSVWWDRHIGSGADFSADIERELRAAKAVIVCWSAHSAKSKWVKDEATLAAREDKLKTISLDGAEAPIGYMQYHALDMSGWKGGPSEPVLIELKNDAKAHFVKQDTEAASAAADGGNVNESPAHTASRSDTIPHTTETGAQRARTLLIAGTIAVVVVTTAYFGLSAMRGGDKTNEAAETKSVQTAANPAPAATNNTAGNSSIAVLPFVNMSSDPEQEYFSDGISEELLNVLAQVPGLQVAGRTSAFAFKGKNTDLREIADILDVAHVLEGSVRKSGDKVRITAQLIRADSGFHLWSDSYDRNLDDIFAVQDEIANAILAELTPHLLGEKQLKSERADIGAYDLYLLAKQRAAPGNLAGYEAAAAALDQAIKIDPDFAQAYAWRAYYEFMMSDDDGASGDIPIEEALPRAQAWTNKALDLDPDAPDSLFAQASFYLSTGKYDLAEAFYKRALEAKPNFDLARNDYAYLLGRQRRFAEANEQLELTLAHNPAQADANTNLTYNYRIMNNMDAAQTALERWARILPDSSVRKFAFAGHLWFSGELAAAMRVVQENLSNNPGDPRLQGQLMNGWLELGEYQRVLDSNAERLKPRAYGQSGQTEKMLELTRAEVKARPDFSGAIYGYLGGLYYSREWGELIDYFDSKCGDVKTFETAFDFPPYVWLVAPLNDANHPQAEAMREAAWTFNKQARAAGAAFGDIDYDEANLLVIDGRLDEAVALLQSAIDKQRWQIETGMDPVYARLKDKQGYIALLDATEAKINAERAKLDLAPITIPRTF